MRDRGFVDFYAVLGVERSASGGELRAVYRRLARTHHPDVAGQASTATFQLVAEAYRVLSNPVTRAEHDELLAGLDGGRRPRQSATTGAAPGPGVHVRTARHEPSPDDLLERFTGHLDELVGKGAARHVDDVTIELMFTGLEAATGGTVSFAARVKVTCPTCGGVALPRALWCMRCEYAGAVAEDVTVRVAVPPLVPDNTCYSVPVDPMGRHPPLRVRVRV